MVVGVREEVVREGARGWVERGEMEEGMEGEMME